MQVALMPLGVALALLVVVAPLTVLVGVVGALSDVLHRRVSGAMFLAFAIYLMVISVVRRESFRRAFACGRVVSISACRATTRCGFVACSRRWGR
jgi:hypothetical membrane protein